MNKTFLFICVLFASPALATNITVPPFVGGPVNGATAGSVLFANPANKFAQDNANLFWDATNHLLGIGTTTPRSKLDLAGSQRIVNSAQSTLSGSITLASSASVVGVGTHFTTELLVGDSIFVQGQTSVVLTITDDTHLTVFPNFTAAAIDNSPKKNPAIATYFKSDGSIGAVIINTGEAWNFGVDSGYVFAARDTNAIAGTLFSPTANKIQIFDDVAGTPVLGLDHGVLALGDMTLAPYSIGSGVKLDVTGSVLAKGPGGSFFLASRADNSGSYIMYSPTQGDIRFYDYLAAADRMTINNLGNVGIGTTTPASLLSVGSGSPFQVNSSGNPVKINNVTTSFPASQGAATTTLINDGAGNLTWSPHVGAITRRVGTNCAAATTCVAACSAGEVALGGGCSAAGAASTLTDSYPNDSTHWTCDYLAAATITPFVICQAY